MKLYFKSRAIQKICNESARAQAKYGAPVAKRLQQRLMELNAAETLNDISHLPPVKLHEHKGSGKGIFTFNLSKKDRLYLTPNLTPFDFTEVEAESGEIDKTKVTEILIIKIDDPHK